MSAKAPGRWHCRLKELLQNAKFAFILRQRQQPRAWEQGRAAAGLWGISRGSLGVTGGIWLTSHGGLLPKEERTRVLWGKSPCILPWLAAPSSERPRGAPALLWLIIARVRSARREIPFKGAEGEAGKKGAAAHSLQPSPGLSRPETRP